MASEKLTFEQRLKYCLVAQAIQLSMGDFGGGIVAGLLLLNADDFADKGGPDEEDVNCAKALYKRLSKVPPLTKLVDELGMQRVEVVTQTAFLHAVLGWSKDAYERVTNDEQQNEE